MVQQTESLNKIYKREGKPLGLSFKDFAEQYNKSKEAPVVEFKNFTKQPAVLYNNAGGTSTTTDPLTNRTMAPVTQSNNMDFQTKALRFTLGVAIGVVSTMLILKYSKNV